MFLILNKNPGFSLWNSLKETGNNAAYGGPVPDLGWLLLQSGRLPPFLLISNAKTPQSTVSGSNQGLPFLLALSKRNLPPSQVVSSATEFQGSEPIYLKAKSPL